MTRKEYLEQYKGKDTHAVFREYYGQFVQPWMRDYLINRLGVDMLQKAYNADPHLNTIALRFWDNVPCPVQVHKHLKEMGDFITLASKVCIFKEAARMVVEEAEITT